MKSYCLLFAVLVLSACRSQERSARNVVDSTQLASQTPPPGSNGPAEAPWFLQDRELDLTDDGRPDTVVLRAEGRSSDSLTVTLRFVVDGVERWHDEWQSDYMLIDHPEFPQGEVSRAAFVRRQLQRTLEVVRVEPFDSTEYVQMADPVDSMTLRRPPGQEIMVAFGYETTIALSWEPAAKSFRRLWSCC